MSKIAFFLGAGFSRGADMPLMGNFSNYSNWELNSIKEKHKKNRNVSPELIEYGDLFESFIRYCNTQKRNKIGNINWNNLEDLFSIAEIMEESRIDSIELDISPNKKYTPNEILSAMRYWTWKIFQRIPIHNPDGGWSINQPSLDLYNLFAKDISRIGPENCSLITTNYDMIAEYSLANNNIPISYPLGTNANYLDIGEKKYRFVDIKGTSEGSIPICKLHGSVNYFFHPRSDSDKIRVVGNIPRRKIGESKLSYGKGGDPFAIMALDALWEIKQNDSKLIPSIIPPSNAKLEKQAWLRNVWNKAINSLIESDVWVFIGYSFPLTDQFMKILMNSAIMQKDVTPRIEVISRCNRPTYNNYCNVFGEGNFRFQGKYLDEFYKEETIYDILKDKL